MEARALRSQGWSISAIARHLDVTRVTVRRYRAPPGAFVATHPSSGRGGVPASTHGYPGRAVRPMVVPVGFGNSNLL